jgi:hypothetical protein
LTVVLDNMISPRIAAALQALGADVLALREVVSPDTPDADIIRELGQRGHALITADQRIRTRPHEAAVLKQARISAFFLSRFWARLKMWDSAVWLIKWWPTFSQIVRAFPAGNCFTVQQNGKMRPISL